MMTRTTTTTVMLLLMIFSPTLAAIPGPNDSRYPDTIVEPRITCEKEGVFPHPRNCSWYYRCVDRMNVGYFWSYHFECEPGTVFSDDLDQCVFPFLTGPPCGTAGPSLSTSVSSSSTISSPLPPEPQSTTLEPEDDTDIPSVVPSEPTTTEVTTDTSETSDMVPTTTGPEVMTDSSEKTSDMVPTTIGSEVTTDSSETTSYTVPMTIGPEVMTDSSETTSDMVLTTIGSEITTDSSETISNIILMTMKPTLTTSLEIESTTTSDMASVITESESTAFSETYPPTTFDGDSMTTDSDLTTEADSPITDSPFNQTPESTDTPIDSSVTQPSVTTLQPEAPVHVTNLPSSETLFTTNHPTTLSPETDLDTNIPTVIYPSTLPPYIEGNTEETYEKTTMQPTTFPSISGEVNFTCSFKPEDCVIHGPCSPDQVTRTLCSGCYVGGVFIEAFFLCAEEEGKLFDKDNNICVTDPSENPSCLPDSTTLTPTTTPIPTTTQPATVAVTTEFNVRCSSEQTRPTEDWILHRYCNNSYLCTPEGLYKGYVKLCDRYYQCYQRPDGEWDIDLMTCPKDQLFSYEEDKCVDKPSEEELCIIENR